MDRRDLADLLVLSAVAEAGSFSRAAGRLGRAQSGLSQTVAALEERLGVPLLARTTRSLRPTEAGQRLLDDVVPALRQIEDGLAATRAGSGMRTGTLRLTTMEHPSQTILMPALASFAEAYPGITFDLQIDDRLMDIVKGGFDAGIRLGSHLEQDMRALPLSADQQVVIVGSPAYFALRGRPETIRDLAHHDCISHRLASHGDLFRWNLLQGARSVKVSTRGRITANTPVTIIAAALNGLGLAYTFESFVEDHLASGRLQPCLQACCPVWPGYHLYYPSKRQKSWTLSAFISHLVQWRQRQV